MWPCVLAALACALCAGGETPPEPPFERGADLIRLELLAAHTGLCALSVAAHPDDEDGATLAWLRRMGGVEVHLCLATRGEGGQNESGPELGAELALKRTRETESAARILGAKVWYLNLPDFGYSKSPEETLKVWNHDEALGRLVRVIRIVQPDILFTNHNPEGTDHGHHVATAKLVFEAYEAATDPKRYPSRSNGKVSPRGRSPNSTAGSGRRQARRCRSRSLNATPPVVTRRRTSPLGRSRGTSHKGCPAMSAPASRNAETSSWRALASNHSPRRSVRCLMD